MSAAHDVYPDVMRGGRPTPPTATCCFGSRGRVLPGVLGGPSRHGAGSGWCMGGRSYGGGDQRSAHEVRAAALVAHKVEALDL